MPIDVSFVYFLFCGVSGLIMWYKMLGILERNGQEVNYFFTNPKYFFAFNNLIKSESDKNNRIKYRLLLYGQILLIPTYVIGMLYLM